MPFARTVSNGFQAFKFCLRSDDRHGLRQLTTQTGVDDLTTERKVRLMRYRPVCQLTSAPKPFLFVDARDQQIAFLRPPPPVHLGHPPLHPSPRPFKTTVGAILPPDYTKETALSTFDTLHNLLVIDMFA
jgi:hypothetical protein